METEIHIQDVKPQEYQSESLKRQYAQAETWKHLQDKFYMCKVFFFCQQLRSFFILNCPLNNTIVDT